MHIFSPTLFSNFSLIYTDYVFNTGIQLFSDNDTEFDANSDINDITLRGEFQIFPHKDHTIKTGIDITNHTFDVSANYLESNKIVEYDDVDFLGRKKFYATEIAIYVQDE
jgi:hypothetical protein